MTDTVFRNDVQCFVRELRYDFRARSGVLELENSSSTDMRGCINLFKTIDPDVRSILTISGGRRDTAYFLQNQKWEARVMPGLREKS